MSLRLTKARNSGVERSAKRQTKAGGPCQAPALEGGLCFFHAHPEKLAALGRQGGQKNRRGKFEERDLPDRSLKNIGEVSELLEETINRVRQGPFDLRAANSIGFLAGILLKALDQRLEDRLAHLEAVMLPSKRGTTDTEAFEQTKKVKSPSLRYRVLIALHSPGWSRRNRTAPTPSREKACKAYLQH
jgi:hypothetical protein